MKLCLVCSSGGHLFEIHSLKDWWGRHERYWVTFKKEDAISLLKGEKVYYAYFPTNRSIKNLIRNSLLALKLLRNGDCNIIVSTGAGVAVPFFYIGKLLGKRTIYIESIARINHLSLTGRIVYPIADVFVVQWPGLRKKYPKSLFISP
nr:UDP-N-acetylglucosamine--LPS N-acetylglucosamine transferase [Desulfobacterales bacterium]